MKMMTLGWRLGAAFGTLIGLMGVIGGIAVWRVNLAATSAQDVTEQHVPQVQVSNRVESVAYETRMNIRSYSFSGGEEYLRAGRRALATLKDHLKEAADLATKSSGLVALKSGQKEASEKTIVYEDLLDSMEAEFKNASVQKVDLDTAGSRFMETTQALRLSQIKQMNEELEAWDAQTKEEAKAANVSAAEQEAISKVDLAALKLRLTQLGLVGDLMDIGNSIRINKFRAQVARDVDGMTKVLKEFEGLNNIIGNLTPLLKRQENLMQMKDIQEAADHYQAVMEKDLKSQIAISGHIASLLDSGNAVTQAAATVADNGLQAIDTAATDVSKGLNLTVRLVVGGLIAALVMGGLVAWLSIRAITNPIREGMNALAATASEISTTIAQLASNASETAAAVAETTTTVDEVRQTAQVAADKAKAVAESAQSSASAAEAGRKATDQTVRGLSLIRDQMSSITESITLLNVQTQAVGDIVSTVGDLAEQSNLLAVNASIEAAKAGEQGRGFGVVAQEIRNLAEQSKDSTKQVRAILTDVQKATGNAVAAAEQGGRSVADGGKQAEEAGQAIRTLASLVQDATRAAMQISASSQQQLVGMEQVGRAMENIRTATTQNAEGAQQLTRAANNLREIGVRLKALVEVDNTAGFKTNGR